MNSTNAHSRKLALYGTTALLLAAVTILAFEGLCAVTYHIAPHVLTRGQIAPVNCGVQQCKSARYHPILGWNTFGEPPFGDGIRENGLDNASPCGVAFGDSFTYGNDVQPDETYSAQLASRLGCNILNYGVGGYSYVQALEKFELYKPEERIVVFVVYEQMLKRALSASTYFISGGESFIPRPYIFMRGDAITFVENPQRISTKSVKQHMRLDYFGGARALDFPYSIDWIRSITTAKKQSRTWHTDNAWTEDDFISPFLIWVEEYFIPAMAEKHAILLLLPSSTRLEHHKDIKDFVAKHGLGDEICISQPGRKLHEKSKDHNLVGPTFHFNKIGNAIIADTLQADLGRCYDGDIYP